MKKNKVFLSCALLWVTIFVMYLQTVAPSVGYIDSGELATVSLSLGIAHPTGYPLFTILSKVFSLLPVADEEIVRLNIFSALLTSSASILFFFLALQFLNIRKGIVNDNSLFASALGTMFLAFSTTFWFQAVSIEVYSLHVVLVCSILLIFMKALNDKVSKWWILFAFLVGLSFTNHLTTILLAPALLYLLFSEFGFNKKTFTLIGRLSIPFGLGLSVYLYLPIRALQSPILNWGNPVSFEKLWWHVTGKQFRVFMFSSSEVAKKQLQYFFENLPNEFFIGTLILSVIGLFSLFVTNKKYFFFLLILFTTCLAYSVNYDIHDIDSYFLLAFITIAISITVGLYTILERLEPKWGKAFLLGSFFAVVVQIVQVYPKVDQSKNYLVEDYTKNILANVPPNAIILSYQWDYFVAASYYYQHIKKVRPDVVILDKELFRRSWYFPQLKNMYPGFTEKSQREIDLFLEDLYKFEHNLPYNFNSIEGRYTDLLKSFIEKNDSVAFYITPEIEPQYTSGYIRIPEGFLFRLTTDTVYQSYNVSNYTSRDFASNNKYSLQLKQLQINAFLRRASYEQSHGKDTLSQLYLQKASEIRSKINTQVSIF